ncbi:hypothetical protein DBR32_14825 [Taibaiella sp. KBW10]|uniref:hypothetical protein n=1 Tax=Taibaiella sp. KBW10 TaxID=2153357 RepID=UPI000F59EEC7|nr:hypothetical protein [Taibaiella sp. KBW10]RQO29852.1 hypothetical protein DBR32_14825 [Taibaiella sp. KBW10]
MEQQQQDLSILNTAGMDDISKGYLMETVRWTKFMAILGFIVTGFMVIVALIFMTVGGIAGSMSSTPFSGLGVLGGIGIGLLYLAFAFLYFYPIFCLYKFTVCMKSGLFTENQLQITEAFRYQRNMYRFMGILAIITISIYILMFLFLGLVSGLGGR